MKTKEVSCTIQGQAGFTTSLVEYSSASTYVSYANDAYWVYVLKFTTPKFSGASQKIAITLNTSYVAVSDAYLRWALCTSDKNHENYRWTWGEVEDETQIKTGTWDWRDITNSKDYTLEIETDALDGNTTYYLYLWVRTKTGVAMVNSLDRHSVVVTYFKSGGARINDGGTVKRFPAVIWNGSAWKRYIPVVYTASGWKRQG